MITNNIQTTYSARTDNHHSAELTHAGHSKHETNNTGHSSGIEDVRKNTCHYSSCKIHVTSDNKTLWMMFMHVAIFSAGLYCGICDFCSSLTDYKYIFAEFHVKLLLKSTAAKCFCEPHPLYPITGRDIDRGMHALVIHDVHV